MASSTALQAEMAEVSCSSLGKNFLIGTTIGLGIGIGVGTALLVVKRITKTKKEDRDMIICMQQLTQELKELRLVLTKQKEEKLSEKLILPVKETRIPENTSSVNLLRDVMSLNSDEDEEFFDFNQEDDIIQVQQTETVMPSLPDDDDIKTILREYEILNDDTNDERDVNKVHQLLESAVKKHPNSSELLWRLGKSYYEVASEKGKDGFLEEKKNLLYKGLAIVQKSVEVGDKVAAAHKWYALLLGSTADYESTQDKILLGFKYKEHISKAIEMNNRDPSSYHLLGRWCFEVSQLPWWQRRAAAALIAEPPTSTVEEALDNFLKAENLDPGFWLTNSYWIARCYYEQSQYSLCKEWLEKVINMTPKSEDDEKSLQDARDLLQKV